MKIKLAFLKLFILLIPSLKAQYKIIKGPADLARDSGDLRKACNILRHDLKSDSGNHFSNYNIACNYAIIGQLDSAFFFLNKALVIQNDFETLIDPDFYNLMHDKRWTDIEKTVSMPYFMMHKDYDKKRVLQLAKMRIRDQAYYWQISIYGQRPTEKDSLIARHYWNIKDSLNKHNQTELEEIIKADGWPKISIVGERGSGTAFLIIQHADLESQKKYIATLTDLAQKGEASWEGVALMTDRILVYEHKNQLYGSQVNSKLHCAYPIEDEKNVDKRRAEKGLGPLAAYLEYFGIKYEAVK